MNSYVIAAGLITVYGLAWPAAVVIIVFKTKTKNLDRIAELIRACHPITHFFISPTPPKEKA